MSNEFDILLASLKGEYGYTLAFTGWVTCLRLVFVFINSKMREFAEQALPAEQAWIANMLNSLPWRLLVFVVNMLTSIKLPTEAKGPSKS